MQTELLTKVDTELADVALQVDAVDGGIRTAVKRINEDLETLDQRVDCCRQECECTSAELEAANGKIAVLEECSRSQQLLIEWLIARVDSIEGRLCRCNEGKGKGRAALEEVSPTLGSPLVLGQAMDEDCHSDDSYHTPPLTSSSAPASSSPSDSDKENVEIPPSGLVEIVEGSSDYDVPLPVPAPVIDLTRFNHLIAVRGQRAVRKLGPPKLVYHPYSRCCTIGARSSTHQPGTHCSRQRLGYQNGTIAR